MYYEENTTKDNFRIFFDFLTWKEKSGTSACNTKAEPLGVGLERRFPAKHP